MNTPANAPLTPAADAQVVARLRAALDEAAATTSAHSAAGPAVRSTPSSSWRWVAAAAAGIALVGGGVLVLRGNSRAPLQPAAADTTAATTPITGGGAWSAALPYILIAADLPPSAATELAPCCMTDNEVMLAWARNGDPGDAVVVARATPLSTEVSPVTTPTATVITVGDSALAVDTRGVDEAERADLLASIQPGSGVPFVLAADGWELISMSTAADAAPVVQQYGSSVRLTVGAYAEVFFSMVSAPSVRAVTVAGEPGWALEYAGGYALVVWRHPESGRWVTMDIGADLAGRVDGLIAAVAVNGSVTDPTLPPPDTVPTPTDDGVVRVVSTDGGSLPVFDSEAASDPAVGQHIPAVYTSAGDLLVDTPTLFVFLQENCTHCANQLPVLVDGAASGALGGYRVVLVSTAGSNPDDPTDSWLAAAGWTGEVLHDDSPGDGTPGAMALAFGAPAWPYMVAVNADGMVTGRAAGEQPLENVMALAATAGPSDVIGRLVIDAIEVDWFVVEGGSDHEAAMERGPIMTADRVTGTPTILGTRTTYGAPFLRLDELQPGDTFTIVSLDGTRTFEVTLVERCEGDEVCAAQQGDDMLLATYDPEFTDRARLTIHATEVTG